jgi:hypothetical protein
LDKVENVVGENGTVRNHKVLRPAVGGRISENLLDLDVSFGNLKVQRKDMENYLVRHLLHLEDMFRGYDETCVGISVEF